MLLLTGHFGNFEVASTGLGSVSAVARLFHLVRRPFKPRCFDALVTRLLRAGFGTLPKRGGLDGISTS